MSQTLNIDLKRNDQRSQKQPVHEGIPTFVWHYTTGEKFMKIVQSGFLLPSSVGVAAGEQPILWFSSEQFWEPTAQKALVQNGELIRLGMKGTFERGGGLVRFGVLPSQLVRWPRLAKVARIPSGMRRSLERTGRDQRSVSERWLGLIGQPLALNEVDAIEVFDGNSWVRVPRERYRPVVSNPM
jgi:hypothetical protein